MKHQLIFLVMAASLLSLASCSHLSPEAKKMVGEYYIPEISEDEPVMELNGDGTCLFRAIKPGVLTYVVHGTWDVVNDSLTAQLDPATLEWEGDSLSIGEIPVKSSRHIVMFNDMNLELENEGIHYMYHRRNK